MIYVKIVLKEFIFECNLNNIYIIYFFMLYNSRAMDMSVSGKNIKA